MKPSLLSSLLLCLITSFFLKAQTNGNPIELSNSNPFKTVLNQPMRYENVKITDFNEYIDAVLAYSQKETNLIIQQKKVSFKNTFGAYDAIYSNLHTALRNANLMIGLMADEDARKAGETASLEINSALLKLETDKKLYQQLSSFSKKKYKTLTASEKRLVDEVLKDFIHSGVLLEDEKEAGLAKLNTDIKGLSLEFIANVSKSRPNVTFTEKEAEGLSESFLSKYKNEENLYVIPVNNATKRVLMKSLTQEESRKKIHFLDQTRGEGNELILDSLVKKRHQLALLLGYTNYADYQLQKNMLSSKDTVLAILNNLIEELKPNAVKAYKKMKANRNSILGTETDAEISPWDQPFYTQTDPDSKEVLDKVGAYTIPMETATRKVFDFYENMFGFEIRQVKNPSVWHEDITSYEVYDNGKLKGRFYMDMYARPKKDPGFRAQWLTFGRKTEKGFELPVGILVADYASPTAENPGVISMSNMTIFIHEFGHIMSMVAYNGDYTRMAMGSTDFIEGMSKMFENWMGEYDFAKTILIHPETGEPISSELFDKYKIIQKEQRAMGSIMQLIFAFYSLQLYSDYNPQNPKNTDQLWRDIDTKIGIFPYFAEGTHPQNNFVHLTNYGASYYSYIWSNLLAQDMFTEFKKNGLNDPKTGKLFRDLILANGIQLPELIAVETFLGRKISNEAYLNWLGVK